MDVTALAFNRLVRLARASAPYILQLAESSDTTNHLGTVHASAQFALAEATSGQYLVAEFPDLDGTALAVVRSFNGKYRSPAHGVLRSAASIPVEAREKFVSDLERRGRGFVVVEVVIYDSAGTPTLAADFEWFVQLGKT
jgi:acyl-coenzyme A thioesterase PaaI-like protein